MAKVKYYARENNKGKGGIILRFAVKNSTIAWSFEPLLLPLHAQTEKVGIAQLVRVSP